MSLALVGWATKGRGLRQLAQPSRQWRRTHSFESFTGLSSTEIQRANFVRW